MGAFGANAFDLVSFDDAVGFAFDPNAFDPTSLYADPPVNAGWGLFKVAPTALTSAGIREAIALCALAGGGEVDLGNATYVVKDTITVDPTIVSLSGRGAKLDASGAADNLVLVQVNDSHNQYRQGTQWLRGIEFIGKGSTHGQIAIQGYTPTNGNDWSSRLTVENCAIHGFGYGWQCKQNSFCWQFRSCQFYSNNQCVRLENEGNRGENIVFDGCTFFNSARVYWFAGANQDVRFIGCSLDYTTQVGYTDGYVSFVGCHIEKNNPATSSYDFEMDNGARMHFYDTPLSYTNTGGTGTVFQSWGTGGGYVDNWGPTMAAPTGCTLINDTSRLTQH